MLFKTGQLMMTPGILEKSESDNDFAKFVALSLGRYLRADWGEMCAQDRSENDRALKFNDGRLFAAYLSGEMKIWIITEADRSVTTVLLPEEY